MICKPGKLVGIPFPYTDLKTKKRRPVLVMTAPDKRGDFMGVAVTSVPTKESSVAINKESMAVGQLPKQSWVRCDKIFTLSETLAAREYGILSDDVFQKIKGLLCAYLGCPDSK